MRAILEALLSSAFSIYFKYITQGIAYTLKLFVKPYLKNDDGLSFSKSFFHLVNADKHRRVSCCWQQRHSSLSQIMESIRTGYGRLAKTMFRWKWRQTFRWLSSPKGISWGEKTNSQKNVFLWRYISYFCQLMKLIYIIFFPFLNEKCSVSVNHRGIISFNLK